MADAEHDVEKREEEQHMETHESHDTRETHEEDNNDEVCIYLSRELYALHALAKFGQSC
jgi:hypothetical protein